MRSAGDTTDPADLPRHRKSLVCLFEQHPFAALVLERLLREAGEFEVLGWPSLPRDAQKFRERTFVLVIDRERLPTQSAGPAYSLLAMFPRARILALGNALPVDDASRLLFLGVHGFVVWNDVKRDTALAARALIEGGLWFSQKVLRRFVEISRRGMNLDVFTKREWEIVGLLDRAMVDKEIGVILNVSESTVRFHMRNIFDKLGVRDRHLVIKEVNRRFGPTTPFVAGVVKEVTNAER